MTDHAHALQIYQVELSSYCNMRCSYCPHPHMKRPKGHMSESVLGKCIDYIKATGHRQIVLHHFGETLLHPHLQDRLMQVAESGLVIKFSTNGLLLDKTLPILLAIPQDIVITLSVHQWSNQHYNIYRRALRAWQDKVKGSNITIEQVYNASEQGFHFHRWTSGERMEWDHQSCFFLKDNWGVVLWNGDVASCCADEEGESILGHISDPTWMAARTRPWRACATCDLFPRQKLAKASQAEPVAAGFGYYVSLDTNRPKPV